MPKKSAREYERLWRLLADIEDGVVTLTLNPATTPEWDFFNVTHYDGSDGSRVAVFVDAGVWDYLDLAILPDGTRWDYEDINFAYTPPDEAQRRYPGDWLRG